MHQAPKIIFDMTIHTVDSSDQDGMLKMDVLVALTNDAFLPPIYKKK